MFILFIDTREDLDKYTIATIKKCKRVEYKFKYKNNTLLERERERERVARTKNFWDANGREMRHWRPCEACQANSYCFYLNFVAFSTLSFALELVYHYFIIVDLDSDPILNSQLKL